MTYMTIKGQHYDKEIYTKCEEVNQAEGCLHRKFIKELLAPLFQNNSLTAVQRKTIDYIQSVMPLSTKADEWLKSKLNVWDEAHPQMAKLNTPKRTEKLAPKGPEQTPKRPEQTPKKPEQTPKRPEQTPKKPSEVEQTPRKPSEVEQTPKKPSEEAEKKTQKKSKKSIKKDTADKKLKPVVVPAEPETRTPKPGPADAKKFWDSIPHAELAKSDEKSEASSSDERESPEGPKKEEAVLDEGMMALAKAELKESKNNQLTLDHAKKLLKGSRSLTPTQVATLVAIVDQFDLTDKAKEWCRARIKVGAKKKEPAKKAKPVEAPEEDAEDAGNEGGDAAVKRSKGDGKAKKSNGKSKSKSEGESKSKSEGESKESKPTKSSKTASGKSKVSGKEEGGEDGAAVKRKRSKPAKIASDDEPAAAAKESAQEGHTKANDKKRKVVSDTEEALRKQLEESLRVLMKREQEYHAQRQKDWNELLRNLTKS